MDSKILNPFAIVLHVVVLDSSSSSSIACSCIVSSSFLLHTCITVHSCAGVVITRPEAYTPDMYWLFIIARSVSSNVSWSLLREARM